MVIEIKCGCGKVLIATSESQMNYNLKTHQNTNSHKRFLKIGKFEKCEVCGNNKLYIYIHHKDQNHLNNKNGNLLYVCSDCHVKIHKKIGFGIKKCKEDKK